MKAAVLFLLMTAVPQARAEGWAAAPAETNDYVDFAALTRRANDLRDAVADPRQTEYAIKGKGSASADRFNKDQIVFSVNRYRMDRAVTTGELGDIPTMQKAAEDRAIWWNLHRKNRVPERVQKAIDKGREMIDTRAINFDSLMSTDQMGKFAYNTETTEGGAVSLNARLKMICALIGDQFCYATAIHELTHKLDRQDGVLTPKEWKKGEVRAFKVQCQWVHIVDETGDQLVTQHRMLELERDRQTDDAKKKVLASAVKYLEHISDVVETDCKDEPLTKLVENLYKVGPDGKPLVPAGHTHN
jgi:hypothetical protein